jgi:hypothetical protein
MNHGYAGNDLAPQERFTLEFMGAGHTIFANVQSPTDRADFADCSAFGRHIARQPTEYIMETSLQLLRRQRSHVLLVLCGCQAGREAPFLEWYQGPYRETVGTLAGVLSAQHYVQHEVDITNGKFQRPPFPYLGLYELSVDGAQQTEGTIKHVEALHRAQPAANLPATWLYYPASEKVGRPAAVKPSLLTVAFANALPGQEAEFREWYATRHVRHAMCIPELVSGQCFERTQFQRPGALPADFSMVAVYEQEGAAESILQSMRSLPQGALSFPALDRVRFAECIYRPIAP